MSRVTNSATGESLFTVRPNLGPNNVNAIQKDNAHTVKLLCCYRDSK